MVEPVCTVAACIFFFGQICKISFIAMSLSISVCMCVCVCVCVCVCLSVKIVHIGHTLAKITNVNNVCIFWHIVFYNANEYYVLHADLPPLVWHLPSSCSCLSYLCIVWNMFIWCSLCLYLVQLVLVSGAVCACIWCSLCLYLVQFVLVSGAVCACICK